MGPPDPQMRGPATRESDRARSQNQSTRECDSAPIDFQARKLRQVFYFADDTARTIGCD